MLRLKTIFGFGSRMVFFAEEDDTNNANADGGKTGDDNKAGGGGGDGGKKDDSSAAKPETHTINVDGTDVVLTLDELKDRASKASGADARFQEAAEMRKNAERDARAGVLAKTIAEADNPSEADIQELAGIWGIDPKEFTQHLSEGDPSQKTGTKTTESDFSAEFKKQFDASPAEVRAILDFSQQRHVNDARKEIREISDKAVDKDEIIGKMIVGENKDKRLLTAKDMVAEDVLRKIQDGKPFGAELVAASVQMVRSKLTKLGIPKKLNQQPIVLGLAPSEGLSSVIQADEPIKRVPSDEDEQEKNLIARYLQKAVHAARSMK